MSNQNPWPSDHHRQYIDRLCGEFSRENQSMDPKFMALLSGLRRIRATGHLLSYHTLESKETHSAHRAMKALSHMQSVSPDSRNRRRER